MDKPHWLGETGLQQCFAATREAGGELRAVGGAVRDFLLGRTPGDVDLASTLPPEATMALAERQGWKAIPTGLAHGTVTLVLPGRVMEITTLRRDVETDGRHAVVAFTDDWAEDAARRDFTVNALYMDAAGVIHDPTGQGRADLEARRLRFIGDAAARITEDALRILRYFRFLAQLGWEPDAGEIHICAQHAALLDRLSGERIAQEMRKLLAAGDAAPILQRMQQIGLDRRLTHTQWQPGALPAMGKDAGVLWARLMALAALPERPAMAAWVAQRWRLSNRERDGLQFLALPEAPTEAAMKAALYGGVERAWVIARARLFGTDDTVARDWAVPVFPVAAKDLLALGHAPGKALGDALRAIEQRWIDSDYQLSKGELLD